MRELYARARSILPQFIKYFGAALVGFIFDFGILIIATSVLGLHYLIGATCGFIVGLIVVYILSSRYVFGESKLKNKNYEIIIFALIGVVGLLILNSLMWIFTSVLGILYIVSKIIATVVVYAWNFFARRSLYKTI